MYKIKHWKKKISRQSIPKNNRNEVSEKLPQLHDSDVLTGSTKRQLSG